MRRLLIVLLAMSPFVVLLALVGANSQGMAQQPTPTPTVEEELAAAAEEIGLLESELEPQCAPEAPAEDGNINQFPANNTKDLKIDIGADQEKDFAGVVTGGNDRGFASSQNQTPGRQGILDSLSKLNKEDIWIFSGHAVLNDTGTATGLVGRTAQGATQRIPKARLNAALRADGNPPGIVFLGGCATADLLPTFVDKGTQVAIGWDKKTSNSPEQAALREFWAKVFANKTFGEAREAAHTAYRAELERLKQKLEANIATLERLLGGDLTAAQRTQAQQLIPQTQAAITESVAELANLPRLVISGKPVVGDAASKKLDDVITVPAPTQTPPPSAVGGIFRHPALDGAPLRRPASSGPSAVGVLAIALGGGASTLALAGAGWRSRRRWRR